MQLPIEKYANFLVCVSDAGLHDAFIQQLRTQVLVDENTVEIVDTTLYDTFGHITDTGKLTSAMSFYPVDLRLDGSDEINLSNYHPTFPKYDETVSPVIQLLIDKFNELLPRSSAWEAKLSFTQVESFWQCSLTGSYRAEYNATSGTSVSIGGLRTNNISSVAMAPDIQTVLHSIRLSLPTVIKG